jgi:hypothetical protein
MKKFTFKKDSSLKKHLASKIKLMFVLAAIIGGSVNIARADDTTTKSHSAADTETVSLLNGKQHFKLAGYVQQPAPEGMPGSMYYNKQAKRIILVSEEPVPLAARAGTDHDFLNGLRSFKDKQKAADPSYTVVSEQTEEKNGLEFYHLEATSNMDGTDVFQATLIAVGNHKFSVIQVISNQKDKAGHIAAVKNITG